MDISSLRERGAQSAFSVSELNGYIKKLFDSDRTLCAVSVKGEISNFVSHRSGHFYFSLKDADGQIKAVMFRSAVQRLRFMPENGMRVVIRGSVTLYQRDGVYQLYANSMEPDGVGALYLAYEQLKERLFREGLFDEYNKKPIPELPERVGVITSPTGAAVRDIINVTGRRFPLAKIYIYPSLVQGEGAVDNLIRAIDYFEKSRLVDVIIIGRGGGSIEDLWAFNSEALARKIFEAKTPIISAVGHETDFTICDFVADMRAPTPSAAAELAVPDIRELIMRVDGASERLQASLIRIAERNRERLNGALESEIFKNPRFISEQRRESVDELYKRARELISNVSRDKRVALVLNSEKINALNPLSVMLRGYAIAERGGELIKCADGLSVGDLVDVRFSDGVASTRVEKITKIKGAK